MSLILLPDQKKFRLRFSIWVWVTCKLLRQVTFSEFCAYRIPKTRFSAFFRSPSELASPVSLSKARKASCSCMIWNKFSKSQGFDRKSPGFVGFLACSTWPFVSFILSVFLLSAIYCTSSDFDEIWHVPTNDYWAPGHAKLMPEVTSGVRDKAPKRINLKFFCTFLVFGVFLKSCP